MRSKVVCIRGQQFDRVPNSKWGLWCQCYCASTFLTAWDCKIAAINTPEGCRNMRNFCFLYHGDGCGHACENRANIKVPILRKKENRECFKCGLNPEIEKKFRKEYLNA
jgi:hypothetical protein